MHKFHLLSALLSLLITVYATNGLSAPSQAMGYEPKYPANFTHFDYVNTDAPKGGELVLASVGNYDTLNPYTLKGLAAEGLTQLMFETLMAPSLDEPFSQYGLLAEDAVLAEDGLSVTFRLHPQARFYDGSPVTAEDVRFSFETLKSDRAHPQFRFYWGDIMGAEVVDERTIRFRFQKVNPELHLIAGQIPIFSKGWVGDGDFSKLALQQPLTSGPYQIEGYDLGKQITYKRNPNYWARDLNSRRGMFNFDHITFKYYRDATVALEAFKAGEYRFNHEFNSKKWATDYEGSRFESNEIIKTLLPHKNNAGMQGFVFNLRRPLFQDRRVRQAISLALDFEWSNQQLFYGQYQRCDSYFSNSELAARGLPSAAELKLLQPFKGQLPAELFTQAWQPPTTSGRGGVRANLRQAKQLLTEAGWQLEDGVLVHPQNGRFEFEVLLVQKGFERILAPFAGHLKKLGIIVEYRTVDVALYQQRMDRFDFDMVVSSFGQSQSPGNELMGMFHSSAAAQEGSRNLMGISDPVVDAMVEQVIYAADRAQLITAVHALDRVLLHGDYLVPHWFIGSHRIAYWDQFGFPQQLPLYYSAEPWVIETWWEQGPKE